MFLLLSPQINRAENLDRENLIGVLLYRISNHIHWANSSSISSYRVHVIDRDFAIAKQLENIANIRRLHDRTFIVSASDDSKIPENVHMVYLANSSANLFNEVRQSINNRNILLVTHNISDQQNIHLNLYDTNNGEIKFHVNKANVINQNLGIDPDIILLGGSEVDVAVLYRQGQEKLDRAKLQLAVIEADINKIDAEKKILSAQLSDKQRDLVEQSEKLLNARERVKQLTDQLVQYQSQLSGLTEKLKETQDKLENQEEKIKQQSATITQHERSIARQQELQNKFEKEIQNQLELISKQKVSLDARKEQLNQQKSEIELRTSILNEQQSKIAKQVERISTQKNIISDQEEKIQVQAEEMSNRGKIIADQRTYLLLMTVMVSMALVIMALIYRNSRQNKKVNQQLTDQRDLLSRSAIELANARDLADKANQAKSSFLANMSHELRTPLNAVLGFSEFLATDSDLTEKQLRYINIINRSGQHLLSMINDVLDISKIEAGMVSVDLASFEIRELCDDVISMFSAKMESANVKLRYMVEEDVPDYIISDSVKLRQILINLLGNSIKFSQNGEIILSVKLTKNQEKVVFKVSDQGIGISKQNLALIFRPFAQVGDASINKKGTGLGLAISRQYALLMGGDLNVESELGKGSIFTFAQPLQTADNQSAKILPFNRHIVGLEDQFGKQSILVVDDHSESRLLLYNILSSVGFHVEEAENGRRATEIFSQHQIDMIFMDINMPIMDGHTACSAIRKMPGGKEVKIVAITANARKEQLDHILTENFNNVVFKPFRINRILDVVAEQLNTKFKFEHEKKQEVLRKVNIDPGAVGRLNESTIESLLASARKLDAEVFQSQLDQIKDNESQSGLKMLAQDFRFDKIIEILEEAKTFREYNGIA